MEKIILSIKYIFAVVGGFLGAIFGGLDGLLIVLIAFTIIDYITGIISAVIRKELDSRVGFSGIFKKIVIYCIVAVAHLIDFYVICQGSTLRTAIILFYIANEGLSILENAGKIGIPIPKVIFNKLNQLRKENDENGNSEET